MNGRWKLPCLSFSSCSCLPLQAGHQLGLERLLRRFEAANDFLILGHQFFRIAVIDLDLMGILAVEIVVALGQRLGADLPGIFGGLAPFTFRTAPPGLFPVELADGQRLGAGVGLVALRIGMLKKPDILGRPALLEEEDIGGDAGIRAENPFGQADDRVQVELFQQFAFEVGLGAFAKEEAVGQDDGGPAGISASRGA